MKSKRFLLSLSIFAFALASQAAEVQRSSTRCQTSEVTIAMAPTGDPPTPTSLTDFRLVGCGEGFPDNLLWHLDRSDSATGTLDQLVERQTTGKGAVVYIADTGVKKSHDEFQRSGGNVVIAGIDALQQRPDPFRCGSTDVSTDPCYTTPGTWFVYTHGSAVASVVAGRNSGVAPDASIVAVTTTGGPTEWLKGMRAIIEHAWNPTTPEFRTGIINISGGVASQIPNDPKMGQLEELMRRMVGGVDRDGNADTTGKRFLFVVAAGNSGPVDEKTKFVGQCDTKGEVRIWPAAIGRDVDGIIAVGGIDRNNELWSGSCKGPLLEVLAPAESILVASITGPDHYRKEGNSGTSYATPYVSGIAARLLELDPTLTPAELEIRMKMLPSFVRTVGADTGEGRVPALTLEQPRRRVGRR